MGGAVLEPDRCSETSFVRYYIPVASGGDGRYHEISGQCLMVKPITVEVCDD